MFCTVLPCVATALLVQRMQLAVLVVQLVLSMLAYQKPKSGVPVALLSTAISYAIYMRGDTVGFAGSFIFSAMQWVNWGFTFPYVPAFTRLIFWLNMSSYYKKCELRGALNQMGRSRTLYLFHPHGVITVGFSTNGVWSREFNERTTELEAGPPGGAAPWRGCVFLIAKALREPSVLFKVVCDVSGRLESATRENIISLMRRGRNLAIIPGGFEDATLYAHGKHRTSMSNRKGLVKYALQHGYCLTPVYTFGENRTYSAFSGLLRLRLWINSFQVPAIAFFGDWRCPLFPRLDAECLSFVGPPLQLPQLAEPTPEQVAEWHAKYLAALRQLFDASKAEAGEPDANLEIW